MSGSPAIEIRPERPAEGPSIRALHDRAFGRPLEGGIVDALRGTEAWIPSLSLVAADGSDLVGHVLVVNAELDRVDAPPARILVLGPIAVVPERQGTEIGTALMRRAIGGAVALAAPAIALVGHETYYPRFGFEPARRLGLEPPGAWRDENWLALRLPAWTPELRGTVRYPAAYPVD